MYFKAENIFHEALGYLCHRYQGFQSKDLKYILGIICPDFTDGLFERREYIRELCYIDDTNERFTNRKIYQSVTFNGATYEIEDNYGNIVTIGSAYFKLIDDMEDLK